VQIELDEFSDGRWPWWIAGPALGLLVVGFFLVSNQPLGASGAYAETAKVLTGRKDAVSWRVWYLVGIPVGGFLGVTVVGDGFEARTGYTGTFMAVAIATTFLLGLAGVK